MYYRDYYRQLPQHPVQPKALTNYLRFESDVPQPVDTAAYVHVRQGRVPESARSVPRRLRRSNDPRLRHERGRAGRYLPGRLRSNDVRRSMKK